MSDHDELDVVSEDETEEKDTETDSDEHEDILIPGTEEEESEF